MSKLETNTIDNISGSSTLTIGDTNTSTIALKSGATLTNFPANTPAFHAFLSADQGSIAGNAETKVQINTEVLDTDGNYDNSTNYRFTPTTAGTYFVYANLIGEFDTQKLAIIKSIIKKNGTTVSTTDSFFQDNSLQRLFSYTSTLIEMNGSSDYLEFYGYIDRYSGGSTTGTFHGSSSRETYFGAYKIIT
jgi:hypothetical protein